MQRSLSRLDGAGLSWPGLGSGRRARPQLASRTLRASSKRWSRSRNCLRCRTAAPSTTIATGVIATGHPWSRFMNVGERNPLNPDMKKPGQRGMSVPKPVQARVCGGSRDLRVSSSTPALAPAAAPVEQAGHASARTTLKTGEVRPTGQTAGSKLDSTQPSVKLADGSKTMTLSLNTTPPQQVRLTASEAETLMQSIGVARSQMQPVPQQSWGFGQSVASIMDPRWTTESEKHKGDTLLHIRDPRFGWLHYTIPRTTAQQLGTLLQKQATLPVRRQADAGSP